MSAGTNIGGTCRPAAVVWSLLVALVPLTFSGSIYEGALLPRLVVLQVGLLVLVAGIAVGPLRRPTTASAALWLPVACFLLLQATSTGFAVNRVESVLQLSQYVCLLTVPVVVHLTLNAAGLVRVVRVAAWAGLPIALIGIAQYGGLSVPVLDRIPSSANPSATFFHRNAAAEYLIAAIPLTGVALWSARSRVSRVSHVVLLALLTAFLVYTRARGAWLGIGCAAVLAVVLACRASAGLTRPEFRRKTVSVAVAVLPILVAALLLAAIPEGIRKPGAQHFDEKKADAATALASIVAEGGDRGRLRMWAHTLELIRENPLGVGIGNWQYRFPEYARGDQVNAVASPTRPHNDYLWIASESGLPGLAVYLWLLATAAGMAWCLIPRVAGAGRALAIGFAAVLCGHAVDACFNFPRERISPALLFWFSLGGISVLCADSVQRARSAVPRASPLGRLAIVLALPVVTASLWITLIRCDYDRHHLQVYAAERRGDWPTVKREANAAMAHGVLRANTAIALGRALWRSGDLDGAEAAYRAALERHPNSLNAYNNLATVLRRAGRPEDAVEALQKSLELLPGFPEALNNLGLAYRDLGRLPEAASVLREAAKALPDVPDVHCNLGDVYRLQGNLPAARECYLQALAVNRDFRRAQVALRRLDAVTGMREDRAEPSAP